MTRELLRRAAAHRETQFLELAANLGIADRLQDFGVQPGDDVLRRAGRRQDRKPGIKEISEQAGVETVGTSGNCGNLFSVVTPISLSEPPRTSAATVPRP